MKLCQNHYFSCVHEQNADFAFRTEQSKTAADDDDEEEEEEEGLGNPRKSGYLLTQICLLVILMSVF